MLGLVAAIILASTYLILPIFRFIHVTGLREIYTALTLLIVVRISFLMTHIGLSPALGTFWQAQFWHKVSFDTN